MFCCKLQTRRIFRRSSIVLELRKQRIDIVIGCGNAEDFVGFDFESVLAIVSFGSLGVLCL